MQTLAARTDLAYRWSMVFVFEGYACFLPAYPNGTDGRRLKRRCPARAIAVPRNQRPSAPTEDPQNPRNDS